MFSDYKLSSERIIHIDEMLKLMAVVTDAHKFEETAKKGNNESGESMENIFDRIITKGRDEGIVIGEKRGEVRVYYLIMGSSPKEIAIQLHEPEENIQEIIKELNQD